MAYRVDLVAVIVFRVAGQQLAGRGKRGLGRLQLLAKLFLAANAPLGKPLLDAGEGLVGCGAVFGIGNLGRRLAEHGQQAAGAVEELGGRWESGRREGLVVVLTRMRTRGVQRASRRRRERERD